MDESIRIRMEGGLETIEAAPAQCHAMEARLRRSTSAVGMVFLNRGRLSDEVQRFARGQQRVDEAVVRLQRVLGDGAAQARCLVELGRARERLADSMRRACWALRTDATGELYEDCQRLNDGLRSRGVAVRVQDAGPPSLTPWIDYARLRSQGALLNVAGPLAIVGFAASSSPLAAPAFVGWLAMNWVWIRRVSRWPCPRCRRPYSGRQLLSPSKCEHCGLQRGALLDGK